MKTITITPTNDEVIPFLTEILSNKKWVSELHINENVKTNSNELELALEKVNKQYGNVLKKLGE